MDLLIGTDQRLTLSGLKNESGDVLTGANVTVVIQDSAGNDIPGEDWPVTFNDRGGGLYDVLLENDLALTPNRRYTLLVVVEYGGKMRTWRELVMAKWGTF